VGVGGKEVKKAFAPSLESLYKRKEQGFEELHIKPVLK
jgi:hypothetical protein